jgi:hypothetical protein
MAPVKEPVREHPTRFCLPRRATEKEVAMRYFVIHPGDHITAPFVIAETPDEDTAVEVSLESTIVLTEQEALHAYQDAVRAWRSGDDSAYANWLT